MIRPEVSFVVPSFNSKATLPLCLRSIIGQKTDIPFEVLVVDSSEDGTSELLAPAFPSVQWLRLAERALPGAARNRGLERVSSPVVAFVDSDVVLEPGWLGTAMVNLGDGVAGICGSVEPYPERNPLGFCLFLIQFSKFLPLGSPRHLDMVPGYAVLLRRPEALSAGGFPEDFPMLEDFLFSRRMASRSERSFLFYPGMRAFHVNKRDWQVISSQLRSHGLWSARARRRAQLPGSFLARSRAAVPFLVPYRLVLILLRTMRWNWVAFLRSLWLSPALVLGLWYWAGSFFKGAGPGDEWKP